MSTHRDEILKELGLWPVWRLRDPPAADPGSAGASPAIVSRSLRAGASPAADALSSSAGASPAINPLIQGIHDRGYLPHIKAEGGNYFVTFRLADSLPATILRQLREIPEKRHSKEIETHLDAGHGECWIARPEVAEIVKQALLKFDGERYRLHAWVVMPNHVHLLIEAIAGNALSEILHGMKSVSAHAANQRLGREGEFWQKESYDHLIRNDADFARCVDYIAQNPVKAGLAGSAGEFQFSSACEAQRIAGEAPALQEREAGASASQGDAGEAPALQGREADADASQRNAGEAPALQKRGTIAGEAPALQEREAGASASQGNAGEAPALPVAALVSGLRKRGAGAGASQRIAGAAPALPLDARTAEIARMDWPQLKASVAGCTACVLHQARNKTVFGVGDEQAEWLFIGEGPGADEDAKGEPFVGQAGKLLDNMLAAIGLKRGGNVYVGNMVKCRPPGNRNPAPLEVSQCEPYLHRQIELLRPKLIVALGKVAAVNLLKREASVASLRGKVLEYRGTPLIITYHPAYLLRSLPDKSKAWEDLCFAVDTMKDLQSHATAPI